MAAKKDKMIFRQIQLIIFAKNHIGKNYAKNPMEFFCAIGVYYMASDAIGPKVRFSKAIIIGLYYSQNCIDIIAFEGKHLLAWEKII